MGQNIKYKFLGIPIFERSVEAPVLEQRSMDSIPQSSLRDPADWLLNAFGYPSSSNVIVSEANALTLSAVWSCIRVLSETIAMLPLNVFTINNGSREQASNDPLQYLLHEKPNSLMTSFNLREVMMLQFSLTGNSYCIIHRDAYNNPVELELIPWSKEVLVTKNENDGRKYFYYRGKTYLDYEILHFCGISFDGLKGINPIQYARENFGTALSLQKFGGTFFKNGARMSGVIEVPGKLDDKPYKRMLESWNDNYAGADNVGKTSILEGGAKYIAQSLNNEDAQYLLSRKFSVEEIARIFRVPLHMVGDLDKATNNNIEHQGIEFVIHTMTPHVVRWEQEMNSKLILNRDRGRKYVKFDMNGLMRGDSAARAAYYKELYYTGAISPNEIRQMEELNRYDGGDKYYIPINMIPSELSGKNIEAQMEIAKQQSQNNTTK